MNDMEVLVDDESRDVVVEDDTTSSDDSGNRDQSTRFLKQYPTSDRILYLSMKMRLETTR